MSHYKKYSFFFIIVFIITLLAACSYIKNGEKNNDEPNLQTTVTQALDVKNNISEKETYGTKIETTIPSAESNNNQISEIDNSDFILSDDNESIELDSIFSNQTTNKTEISQSYIGEVYVDEYAYKYYLHNYEGFDLYVSNAYYNLKNRNFDEYHVISIKLTKPMFKTSRGITVGNTKSEVINKYGMSTYDSEETILTYRYKDKGIKFEFNEKDVLIAIVLGIVSE